MNWLTKANDTTVPALIPAPGVPASLSPPESTHV